MLMIKIPSLGWRLCEKIKIQNIFVKGYTPNWSKEVFVISKIKNTVP